MSGIHENAGSSGRAVRSPLPSGESEQVRRRVWVQNVAVQARLLEARLDSMRVRNGGPAAVATVDGVEKLLKSARDAAHRDNPIPTRWSNWWRGTLIEGAYQNLHAAESLMAGLYNRVEIDAELPEAVARVEAGLSREDPRRLRALQLLEKPSGEVKAEQVRKLIEVGYGAADRKHSRLRSFRNLILGATVLIAVFVIGFVATIMTHPNWVPLCFTPDGPNAQDVCPTGGGAPSPPDVLVIALLGLLGGALAAAVAIRKINGTATPYDVPAALAMLKVPFGAMTSIGVLIAIGGNFVPGLSNLDSQVQILAYALVFGYAQQLLTGFIDRQAEAMLAGIPLKDSSVARPEIVATGLQPGGAAG